MSWTIVGPHDVFQRYSGRQFGSGDALVRIGVLRVEGEGVRGRRAAAAHSFKQEWIEEFEEALRRDQVSDQFEFRRAGLPDDWRDQGAPGLIIQLEEQELLKIAPAIEVVSEDLFRRIQELPEDVYRLTPRQFEELVAELLSRQGYEVSLTPESNDGGIDVIAVGGAGLLDRGRFLVQAKRYQPDNRVGVGVVRELYGVVEETRATAGIVVTSSFFTRGARKLQERLASRMSLADFDELRKWILEE